MVGRGEDYFLLLLFTIFFYICLYPQLSKTCSLPLHEAAGLIFCFIYAVINKDLIWTKKDRIEG